MILGDLQEWQLWIIWINMIYIFFFIKKLQFDNAYIHVVDKNMTMLKMCCEKIICNVRETLSENKRVVSSTMSMECYQMSFRMLLDKIEQRALTCTTTSKKRYEMYQVFDNIKVHSVANALSKDIHNVQCPLSYPFFGVVWMKNLLYQLSCCGSLNWSKILPKHWSLVFQAWFK